MPVILIYTNWHPLYDYCKEFKLGYWHCAALTNHLIPYSDQEMKISKEDWSKTLNFDKKNNYRGVPAIGIYVKGKERDYSDLRPICLIAYNFTKNYNKKWPYQFQIRTHFKPTSDNIDTWKNEVELNLSSKELKEKIELALGSIINNIKRAYFVFLEDKIWEETKSKIDIQTPAWWEKFRKGKELSNEVSFPQLLYRADDGHLVRSRAELIIDNILFEMREIHVYEHLLGERNFTCDFYLPNCDGYIEYWGLSNLQYRKRRDEKRKYYEKNGISERLLELEDEDISDTQKLRQKIQKFIDKLKKLNV